MNRRSFVPFVPVVPSGSPHPPPRGSRRSELYIEPRWHKALDLLECRGCVRTDPLVFEIRLKWDRGEDCLMASVRCWDCGKRLIAAQPWGIRGKEEAELWRTEIRQAYYKLLVPDSGKLKTSRCEPGIYAQGERLA